MMKISDIVNKEFSRSFMGYDMREVDYFLDEIIEQLETYERERQEMLTAMEYLLRELEQFDEIADDAEKQIQQADAPQASAAPEGRARRTMRVNPAAVPANPEEEPPLSAVADIQPDTDAQPDIVLEELELDLEPSLSAEPSDAADESADPEYAVDEPVESGDAANEAAEPEARASETAPEQQAECAPDVEMDAGEASAGSEQPQTDGNNPTGKETN